MLKKTDADKYEIKSDLFKLTKILGYGDCLYYSVSMYFYNHQNNHLKIRNEIYNYLRDKKDRYFEYFVNENFLESVKENIDNLIEDYIVENYREGKYGGDLELILRADLYNIKIIVLTVCYTGYNVYNNPNYMK